MERNVLAARLGNKKALEAILTEIYPALYRTAFIYTKNEADALDVVQDSVEKIILNINSLKHVKYFETWAIRIAIFTSLDLLKKSYRKDEAIEVEVAELTPISLDEKIDIYQAVASLPENLQEVTVLHYFHGKKIKEISKISGMPEGTVKYKLHQIREYLKNYLEGGMDDES